MSQKQWQSLKELLPRGSWSRFYKRVSLFLFCSKPRSVRSLRNRCEPRNCPSLNHDGPRAREAARPHSRAGRPLPTGSPAVRRRDPSVRLQRPNSGGQAPKGCGGPGWKTACCQPVSSLGGPSSVSPPPLTPKRGGGVRKTPFVAMKQKWSLRTEGLCPSNSYIEARPPR